MVIGYVQRLQTPIIARPSENLTVRLLITDTDGLTWVLCYLCWVGARDAIWSETSGKAKRSVVGATVKCERW